MTAGNPQRYHPSYLDEEMLPYPFCPGCGHGTILDRLDQALVKTQLDPHKVVIVTDIGCTGLSDRFYKTNAFHGLHGRSLTYGTGIKLANPDLNVIVLLGDGGCGIGGHHLINAARRNIGITVLVFNNLNYGMTGGQHSATTLPGALSPTTPFGNIEHPMDICATATVNGASYVARTTSFDDGLGDMIAEAIHNDGFSVIDIWELCVAYYVPNNRFNRKNLQEGMRELGFSSGVLHREPRDEYSRAYRKATNHLLGQESLPVRPLEVKYSHALEHPLECVIAGAAGMRIGTAASALSRGAVVSGLWAAQDNNYPVTVRSGFSTSYVGLRLDENPSHNRREKKIYIVLFPEGLKEIRPRLSALTGDDILYHNAELSGIETRARMIPMDFSKIRRKTHWSVVGVAEVLRHSGIYPLEAFREAIALQPRYGEENLAAIDAGIGRVIPVVG